MNSEIIKKNFKILLNQKNLIELKDFLKDLFTNIEDINKTDIELYNKVITSKFETILEKMQDSYFIEDIIIELGNISIPDKLDDNHIRIIVKDIINLIYKYSKKTMDVKNSFTSKNAVNAEFLNNEFIKLGELDANILINYFEDLEYFEKDSASQTIIIRGKIIPAVLSNSVKSKNSTMTNKTYYMKLFRTDEYNENLIKELNTYEFLFNLINYNITPHILCRIYTGKVTNIFDLFENVNGSEKIIKLIKQNKLESDAFKNNEAYMIMTEPGSMTLYEFLPKLIKLPNYIDILDQITVQILYTLYIFNILQFEHGDLHLRNVFIEELDEPIVLNYKVYGMYYTITTKYMIKIYDFDYSSFYKKIRIRFGNNKIKMDPTDELYIYTIINAADLDILHSLYKQIRNMNNEMNKSNKDMNVFATFVDKNGEILEEHKLDENNYDYIKSIWQNNEYLNKFEVDFIDDNETLVYTGDEMDYKIK